MMLTHSNPACNGTIVVDTEMGEVIQLQGDQRKDVQEFLVDKKEGLGLDTKTIKVFRRSIHHIEPNIDMYIGSRLLGALVYAYGRTLSRNYHEAVRMLL